MIEVLLSGIIISLSSHSPDGPATCDGGSGYYDPVHQICQPNMPGDPQPGYGQFCDGGNFYDPTHGVCAPYAPAYPPPMYPDY